MAKLHVGAVYLNRSAPVSGVGVTSCILPGTYVAEITQRTRRRSFYHRTRNPFPRWESSHDPAPIVGEVWLTNVAIDKPDDPLPILQLQGTANKDGDSRPFRAAITIGSNRTVANTDATQAGALSTARAIGCAFAGVVASVDSLQPYPRCLASMVRR